MPPKVTDTPYARQTLLEMLEGDPSDWKTRKTYVRLLFDSGETLEAAEVLWRAPEIPSVDFDIAFAARVLAKGAPRRAIRLLTAVLEQNRGRPAQSLGIANALLHHGMVMQAARFYGAAIEADPSGGGELLNPDLEHFLLWVDDTAKLWGDFEGQRDRLDDLPWMKRDEEEAERLRKAMKGHTTPIRVPHLPETMPTSPAPVIRTAAVAMPLRPAGMARSAAKKSESDRVRTTTPITT